MQRRRKIELSERGHHGEVFSVIGDGMYWRRAIEPGADMRAILPAVIEMIGSLLNPTEPAVIGRQMTMREANR